ncbi:Asp-tRNA(Asn)/Glu-tRNA(Gln) amidotransferase subunit GatC [Candidatus Acetothermia bacterium]|nr:Asp-tRNA(Asn)/Glu-tRNA(Gln) amidotransferase subunit GatC [Candidatus Acetothermia bacterium]MBI3643739.1 Asp-tRNA(Asn)/Glu-tRNA(Gln) amidotransferase subunit GatC [Candidatus Acetothermia bacterium]
MVEISHEEVLQIASLARLKLSVEEVLLFQEQLVKILDHFQALSEVDTSHVQQRDVSLLSNNLFREDQPRPSIPVEEALKNAPKHKDGFFVVPKVLEKG